MSKIRDAYTAALLEHNLDVDVTYEALKGRIGTSPFVHVRQLGEGVTEPRPLGRYVERTEDRAGNRQFTAKLDAMGNVVRDRDGAIVKVEITAEKDKHFARTMHQMAYRQLMAVRNELRKNGTPGAPKPEVKDDHKPVPPPPVPHGDRNRDAAEFLRKWQKVIRPEQIRRNAQGATLPPVSMRGAIDGAKAWRQGISFDYTLHSLLLPWEKDQRQAVGVRDVDPAKAITHEARPIGEMPKIAKKHKLLPLVEAQLRAGNIPYLVGPAGTGKSTIAPQVAVEMGLENFAYVPFTAGATTTWITGAFTLDGWITRPFLTIYTEGGVFLADEVDAADPNMLLLLNNALSSDRFFNPADGKMYLKSKDFRCILAGNTLGLGATTEYGARQRLDMATLDRSAAARTEIGYDEDLEASIFWAHINA